MKSLNLEKISNLFVALSSTLALSSLAHAQSGEVSFTPTGIKLPIMKIVLSSNQGAGTGYNSSGEQILYQCPSAKEADCLVDLADQSALDAISATAGSAAIAVGTYDSLALYTCADGKGGANSVAAYIKGSFTTEATTYFTDADPSNASGINTVGPADFAQIENWGCSTKVLNLSAPLQINKGDAVDVSVLVDNTLAGFSTPSMSSGMGGVKAPDGGNSRGVAMTYPALIPVLGSGTATTERYLIAQNSVSVESIDDTKANAMVIVAREGNLPIMAFGREIYSETSAVANSNQAAPTDTVNGGLSYVTATDVESFKVNADGSIRFAQGGSADIYAAVFGAFQLADHTGVETDQNGDIWYYHAMPQ